MVPTYFRRELRDRALQRRLRLRTFPLTLFDCYAFALAADGPGDPLHRFKINCRCDGAALNVHPGPTKLLSKSFTEAWSCGHAAMKA